MHRGFEIKPLEGEPGFGAYKSGVCWCKCNTGWGCKVWIDEFLQP